jgi:hypothetical protein
MCDDHATHNPTRQRVKDWVRFVIGLVMLGSCVAFFASGYSPPGVLGAVLRHNQQHGIDASPLIYSEVENMQELEAALAELMAEPGYRRAPCRPARNSDAAGF